MDKVSFQNGFICGMATKGLTRSGELYQPAIYNDPGEYHYFYIDFRRAMQAFSYGMFTESIIVHDSVQLPITGVEQAWAQNPYHPVTDDVPLEEGTKIDTIANSGVLTLGVM